MRLRHILVVEDSDEDYDTVQDAATRRGLPHAIVRARSGGDCLRLLRGSPGGREALPLLVLLDLNTPGDDGRDVLRTVRSDAALCSLPVVVLSASSGLHDLHFCYAHGANAYHVKPTDHASHMRALDDIFAYWLGSVALPA
jgi:CheY-like chemotaxis protein